MAKTIPYRKQNVFRQRKANSVIASSAKRAAKKLKKGKLLHVRTPNDSKLEFLKREGLLAPDEITSVEDQLPLDFTRLGNKQLGAVHSRYSVRYAHALFVLSKLDSILLMLERDRHLAAAKFRVLHGEDFKKKYELDDALILSKPIKSFDEKIIKLKAETEVIGAVLKGYESLVRGASREMSRRSNEFAPND